MENRQGCGKEFLALLLLFLWLLSLVGVYYLGYWLAIRGG